MIQINMKMPSSCYDCPFAKNERTNDYGSFCECGILEDYETINLLEHSKHSNCPLIEQEPIIDKIRAEIENHCGLVKENHCKYCSYCNSVMGVREILEIINKYKAESEGE